MADPNLYQTRDKLPQWVGCRIRLWCSQDFFFSFLCSAQVACPCTGSSAFPIWVYQSWREASVYCIHGTMHWTNAICNIMISYDFIKCSALFPSGSSHRTHSSLAYAKQCCTHANQKLSNYVNAGTNPGNNSWLLFQ